MVLCGSSRRFSLVLNVSQWFLLVLIVLSGLSGSQWFSVVLARSQVLSGSRRFSVVSQWFS